MTPLSLTLQRPWHCQAGLRWCQWGEIVCTLGIETICENTSLVSEFSIWLSPPDGLDIIKVVKTRAAVHLMQNRMGGGDLVKKTFKLFLRITEWNANFLLRTLHFKYKIILFCFLVMLTTPWKRIWNTVPVFFLNFCYRYLFLAQISSLFCELFLISGMVF